MTEEKDGSARLMAQVSFAIFCAVAAAALTTLLFFEPKVFSPVVFCPFNKLTGLYCPGCGTTRAVHALLHGDPMQAFAYNPLAILLSPLAGYLFAAWGAFALFGRRLPLPRPDKPMLFAALAVFLAFTIARNVPAKPFSLLAPHKIESATQSKDRSLQSEKTSCRANPPLPSDRAARGVRD